MIISKRYSPDNEGGGDGKEKKKLSPPDKYKPLSKEQRRDWNDYLDYLQNKGIAGSKDLDQPDKNVGLHSLEDYKKENPKTSLSAEMIPSIQYEQQAFRSGNEFPGVTLDQLKVLRKQVDPKYLERPTANVGDSLNSTLSREYYPSFKEHGTDIEGYVKDYFGEGEKNKKPEGDKIPLPNYDDPASRMNYLKQWSKKYGDLEGRGDTVLKVNEIPRGGSDTMKNISIKAAKEYGIDPALLYSSAMQEGASALFKDKSGLDTRHKKPEEFGYQAFYGDKEFPINGNESMGVPDFANRFPELVAGGYLPKEFASKFRGKKDAGEYSENDFKTVEDGMKAKAALMKFGKDYVDKQASEKDIKLSKNAKDFFSLVFFNGGEGGVKKLLKRYNEEGLLKDDKFLKEHPHKNEKIDPKDDIWAHVAPRLKMASNLKKEKHFE